MKAWTLCLLGISSLTLIDETVKERSAQKELLPPALEGNCTDPPETPEELTASYGAHCDRVSLTWAPSLTATRYRVFRNSEEDPFFAEELGEESTPGFTDFSGTPGVPYFYWVNAENECGESDFTEAELGLRLSFLPGPTDLRASDATFCDRVEIRWNHVTAAESYRILRGTSSQINSAIQIGTSLSSPFVDFNVAAGAVYHYWVQGQNEDCQAILGSLSDTGSRSNLSIPSAPANVSASDGQFCEKVQVSWANVSSASSYRIFRSNTPSITNAVQIGIDTNGTPFDDLNADPGVPYYYWVQAQNSCGLSTFGSSNSGFRAFPSPPTGVIASDSSFCDRVELQWNAVPGAAQYRIYRHSSLFVQFADLIGTTANTNFQDLNGAAQANYFYWVRTVNACGVQSNLSSPDLGSRTGGNIPGAPTQVNASDGNYCEYVQVFWTGVQGSTRYRIFRSTTNESSSAIEIGIDLQSPFQDVQASASTNYFYWVKAENLCGIGPFSASNSGFRGAPATPVNLSATDGNYCERVRVSWNDVPGADSYRIYRNTTNNPTTAEQLAVDGASPYNDTSAQPGITYFYWVKAENDCGISTASAANDGYRRAVPLNPSNVAASSGSSCSYVQISWSGVSGVSQYSIWRSAINNSNTAAQVGTSAASPFQDSTATAGTHYFYWVRAQNDCGISLFSNSAEGFRATTPNTAPNNVQASNGTFCNKIQVSWSAVPGVSLYSIWRSSSNNSNTAQLVANGSTTLFEDFGVGTGVYFYWVKSMNSCGGSVFSAPDSGYRSSTPIMQGPVVATDGSLCQGIQVSWPVSSGATIYKIYRSTINNESTAAWIANDVESPYNDSNVEEGVSYYYFIKAANDCGTSAASVSDSGFAGNTVSAPTGLSTSYNFCDRVQLNWNAVPGASHYLILRNNSVNGNTAVVIGNSTNNSFADTTAQPGVLYWYWVKAQSGCNTSNVSNYRTGRRSTCP